MRPYCKEILTFGKRNAIPFLKLDAWGSLMKGGVSFKIGRVEAILRGRDTFWGSGVMVRLEYGTYFVT